MKTLINFLICFLLFAVINAKAQHKGILFYEITIDNKMAPQPVKVNSTVYFDGLKSTELMVPKNINKRAENEVEEISSTSLNLYVTFNKPYFVFKDFALDVLYTSDFYHVKNVRLIKDTLNKLDWTVTSEKQKIGDYNCTKATTTFRGRNYVAWFTKEVNIENGPWKFSGLPGLIVNVYDTDKMYNYELQSINTSEEFDSSFVGIPKAFEYTEPISHGEFMAYYLKKIAEDEEKSKVVTYDLYGSGTTTIKHAPKREKF